MTTETRPGPLDRMLGLFSDVRPGEGARAVTMLLNIFLILVCYYIIKTVREPLILTTAVPEWLKRIGVSGPAEVKTYAAAGQALVLMGFVPVYSWFASRVDRMKLVFGVTAFFVANIILFALALQAQVEYIGVFFYVWVGLFSLSIIAQFWSYANDIYTKEAGNRLFPIIGVGMTVGSPVGAGIAERMFSAQLSPHLMLYLAAALLLATAGLYAASNRTGSVSRQKAGEAPIGGRGAFSLVFSSRYISLIAVLLILLNVVNTVGEFILSDLVVSAATEAGRANPSFDTGGNRRFLWQLLPLCESPRGGAADIPGAASHQEVRPCRRAVRAAVHCAGRVWNRGLRRDDRHGALGEDGGELDRLLGHEYRQAVAVAADVA